MASFGITALGTYRQLPLFLDQAQYENPDGTFSYYIPPGAVLVAATPVSGFEEVKLRCDCSLVREAVL
jgi:hypothetical protein